MTSAYSVNYKEYLPRIFKILDEISKEVATSQKQTDEPIESGQDNKEPEQKITENTTVENK